MTINKPLPAKDDAVPPFPSARYFQIHFQYLQEIIADLKAQVETANRQIAELKDQLPATARTHAAAAELCSESMEPVSAATQSNV